MGARGRGVQCARAGVAAGTPGALLWLGVVFRAAPAFVPVAFGWGQGHCWTLQSHCRLPQPSGLSALRGDPGSAGAAAPKMASVFLVSGPARRRPRPRATRPARRRRQRRSSDGASGLVRAAGACKPGRTRGPGLRGQSRRPGEAAAQRGQPAETWRAGGPAPRPSAALSCRVMDALDTEPVTSPCQRTNGRGSREAAVLPPSLGSCMRVSGRARAEGAGPPRARWRA